MVKSLKKVLEVDKIHESWKPFFTDDRLAQLEEIEKKIGLEFTPKKDKILRFASQDLYSKKVIWLGQDPYFQPDVANGRSFQPDNLQNWAEPFKQVSLKNIVRLVHASYHQYKEYDQIKTYKEIVKEIETGEFPISQPKEWFDHVEAQGVLFLNTSFTCEVNEPNSHKNIWRPFAEELLTFISNEMPHMIWFLWGKEAISNKMFIKNGVFYESRHPMMCSSKYEDDFLKSQCFLKTFDLIDWLGR